MKSVYLFLVSAAVAVTCKPQRSNNDIIWYPVDDEDGIFVSLYGEKHRSSQPVKGRSNRRTRAARNFHEDPTENTDPSFFNNIRERRPHQAVGSFGQHYPRPVHTHPFPSNPFLNQGKPNYNENNVQELINEIFDVNKHPPVGEFPGQKPDTESQWGAGGQRPGNPIRPGGSFPQRPDNSFGGQRPTDSEWINRPTRPQRPTNSEWTRPDNSFGGQKPTDNEWNNRPGSNNARPTRPQRPTNSEWITPDNSFGGNRPQKPTNSQLINRPNFGGNNPNNSDKLVFPEGSNTDRPTRATSTSTEELPTEPPTMSPCERKCPVTPEFNPVCGSDMVSYSNAGRLKCAQSCGKDVVLAHHGNCGRPRFITPLVSTREDFDRFGFW